MAKEEIRIKKTKQTGGLFELDEDENTKCKVWNFPVAQRGGSDGTSHLHQKIKSSQDDHLRSRNWKATETKTRLRRKI
jgi:hypothetical protein